MLKPRSGEALWKLHFFSQMHKKLQCEASLPDEVSEMTAYEVAVRRR